MRENIWGKSGCELPNGSLCDSCCTLMGINDPEYGENGFTKPIGVPCPLMRRIQGKGEGCGVHEFSPRPCQNYHCSQSTPDVQMRLVLVAFGNGQVTEEEARHALKGWNQGVIDIQINLRKK